MIDRRQLDLIAEEVHRSVRVNDPESYAAAIGFETNDLGKFIMDFIYATRDLETDLAKFGELSKLFIVGFLVGRMSRV